MTYVTFKVNNPSGMYLLMSAMHNMTELNNSEIDVETYINYFSDEVKPALKLFKETVLDTEDETASSEFSGNNVLDLFSFDSEYSELVVEKRAIYDSRAVALVRVFCYLEPKETIWEWAVDNSSGQIETILTFSADSFSTEY